MAIILVVAEHRAGELRPVSLEMISAAQTVRKSADDKVLVTSSVFRIPTQQRNIAVLVTAIP